MSGRRVRWSTAAACTILVGIGLMGCTSSASQSVTVTYQDASTDHKVDVKLPVVKCVELGSSRLISSGETLSISGPPARFGVVQNSETGVHVVKVQVTEKLWFFSEGDFTLDGTGLKFDSLQGTVGPIDESGVPVDTIDRVAVLDGELKCTS